MPGPEIHEGEEDAYDADAVPPSPTPREEGALVEGSPDPVKSAAVDSRLDESLEDTFPASDPVPAKHIT